MAERENQAFTAAMHKILDGIYTTKYLIAEFPTISRIVLALVISYLFYKLVKFLLFKSISLIKLMFKCVIYSALVLLIISLSADLII